MLHELLAEEDLRHVDGVLGALGRRHGAHEGLVAVAHVAVHHVEMSLVDGQIDGLADGAARVVHGRAHVGELHEVAEVLDGGVAAAFVEAADERSSIGGYENRVIAADDHTALGIAGVLRELGGGGLLDEVSTQATGEAHAFAVDAGAGVFPQGQCAGIVAKVEAHLLENGVGVVLDEREPFLVQELVDGYLAGDIGNRGAA